MTLTRRFQFTGGLLSNRFDLTLRAKQILLGALECFVRPLKILLGSFALAMGVLEILLRAFALILRTLQVALRLPVIGLRLTQRFFRRLTICVRPLQILLGAFVIRLRTRQVLLCALTFVLCPRQFFLRSVPIGIRPFTFGLHPIQVGLGTLQIPLRARALRVKAFDLGAGAFAFRGNRFVELSLCMNRCVGRGLLRLHPRAHRLGSQSALDIRARRRYFRLEPRSPLSMHVAELRAPALFGLGVCALTGFLHRLLMRLRQVAKLFKLCLKPRTDTVDDSAKLFLGHLFALSGARSD